MKDSTTFYTKLKSQLEDTTQFPADYLYKFIVPTDKNQEEEVKELFYNSKADLQVKKSKTGKYVSVSVRLKVASSDEIIAYYKKAAKIKGIISL